MKSVNLRSWMGLASNFVVILSLYEFYLLDPRLCPPIGTLIIALILRILTEVQKGKA